MTLPPEAEQSIARLLRKRAVDPWSPEALALPQPARRSEEDEAALVQYLVDFQQIERMAGAMFGAMAERVNHAPLRDLLCAFVEDEARHAGALRRLEVLHNQRRLRVYEPTPSLVRLGERLAAWIRLAPPEAAAVGVTVGEIAFDIAYLGPLEVFAEDPATATVLARIHRDEARHLALDHLLLDLAPLLEGPELGVRGTARYLWAWVRVLEAGFPFMRDTFFGTSGQLDPEGQRLREAARRIELAMDREAVRRRPVALLYEGMQRSFEAPLVGDLVRRVFAKILRADPDVFRRQTTAKERASARQRTAGEAAEAVIAEFSREARISLGP